jgi:hypothetical protein
LKGGKSEREFCSKEDHRYDVFSHHNCEIIIENLSLALLQIPIDTIGKHGILKFDLDFGPVLHNFSIDIGL